MGKKWILSEEAETWSKRHRLAPSRRRTVDRAGAGALASKDRRRKMRNALSTNRNGRTALRCGAKMGVSRCHSGDPQQAIGLGPAISAKHLRFPTKSRGASPHMKLKINTS